MLSLEASRLIVFGLGGWLVGCGLYLYLCGWLAFRTSLSHSRLDWKDFLFTLLSLFGAFMLYAVPRADIFKVRGGSDEEDNASFDFDGQEQQKKSIKRGIFFAGIIVLSIVVLFSCLRYHLNYEDRVKYLYCKTPLKGERIQEDELDAASNAAEANKESIQAYLQPRGFAILSSAFILYGGLFLKFGTHAAPPENVF